MNYSEAKKLAVEWTHGHDVSLDGWRSVIAVLLQRVNALEGHLHSQNERIARLNQENEALSLDLGIREKDFRITDQPQLQTIADIIRECERKG